MTKGASFLDDYGFSPASGFSQGDQDAIGAGGDEVAAGAGRFLVKEVTTSPKQTSSYRKRRQFLVEKSVDWNVKKYGVERCAFLTLTVENELRPDGTMGPPTAKEMMKRLKSLATHVLKKEFVHWIRVYEEGEFTGRPHFHFFVVTKHKDIRTGFDFEAFKLAKGATSIPERRKLTRIYSSSACPELKAEWPKWRKIAKAYHFGSRVEFAPIFSAKNAGAYIGAYLGKDCGLKGGTLKGLRVLGASKGALIGTVHLSIALTYKKNKKGVEEVKFSPGAWLWRRKMEVIAKRFKINDYAMFKVKFGSKWGYTFRDLIASVDLVKEHGGSFTYPNLRTAELDGHEIPEGMDISGPVTITINHNEVIEFPREIVVSDDFQVEGSKSVADLDLDKWIDSMDLLQASKERFAEFLPQMSEPLYEVKPFYGSWFVKCQQTED